MAAAISLFGFESGAALATVVGVLIEVPVMLSVVRIVNCDARAGTSAAALFAATASVGLSPRKHGDDAHLVSVRQADDRGNSRFVGPFRPSLRLNHEGIPANLPDVRGA